MSNFSLINVQETDGDYVVGTWLQDCVGTRQDAEAKAQRTEEANGNKITVAVTERVAFGLADGPGRARRAAPASTPPTKAQMAPGQEPYTQEEWDKVQALIRDAIDDDPGEEFESLEGR